MDITKLLGPSWKTSLLGILAGVAQILYPILATGRAPTVKECGMAVVTVIAGLLCKDHDVSGKTVN